MLCRWKLGPPDSNTAPDEMVIRHAMNAFDRNIRDGARCGCRDDEVEYVLTAIVFHSNFQVFFADV